MDKIIKYLKSFGLTDAEVSKVLKDVPADPKGVMGTNVTKGIFEKGGKKEMAEHPLFTEDMLNPFTTEKYKGKSKSDILDQATSGLQFLENEITKASDLILNKNVTLTPKQRETFMRNIQMKRNFEKDLEKFQQTPDVPVIDIKSKLPYSEQGVKSLEKEYGSKNVIAEPMEPKGKSDINIADIISDAGKGQLSLNRLHNEGLVRAASRQIIGEDIKAGKLKLDPKILNEKDPVEILRTHYGEDVLEQLDSLTPDFNQMYDAKEAADFARKKYPLTPLEKPVKGSVTYDELEKEFYKNEFKQAMQEGVKDSNRMIELGLDPSKSKDYDKFLKMEEIKQKYGTAISDDLLQKIMIDDNPQRQAEVLAAIDEAIKMQEKGLSPDEIIDIMTNTPRTKQAKGGIAGLGNI